MTRRRSHDAVLRSLDVALAHPGLQQLKLDVVMIRGLNDSEVFDFVTLTKGNSLSVRFIEFMPFAGNLTTHSSQFNLTLYSNRQQVEQGQNGPLF
jgi:cyclic pyranopterin phosphate synthase